MALAWSASFAPAAAKGDDRPAADDVAGRIQRLEADNELLRSELHLLRERLDEAAVLANSADGDTPGPLTFDQEPPREPEDEAELGDVGFDDFTRQGSFGAQPSGTFQSVPLLEGLALHGGQYRIVPYGIGWLNVAYDTSRTVTGPFVLYVESHSTQPEASFVINSRSTRLGLNVFGPDILGTESRGRVEIDFFGRGQTENRSGLLLRHAYGEFLSDEWRVLGGQTEDVISPLFPNVLNYHIGRAGGNIGYRRPQVRVERYLRLDDRRLLTLEGSINQTVVTDFASDIDPGGENAGWPTVMGRAAITFDRPDQCDRPVEIGISGHIGEEGVDFHTAPFQENARFLSWSLNVDVEAPVNDRCGVRGEFFYGQTLGTFLGGINQGIDPVLRRGIRSTGGWGEFWLRWNEQWHSHVGYGIDDPNNSDVSAGRRSQNQFWFSNLIWDITPLFNVGVEVSRWETKYVGLSEGEAVRIEMTMKYRF